MEPGESSAVGLACAGGGRFRRRRRRRRPGRGAGADGSADADPTVAKSQRARRWRHEIAERLLPAAVAGSRLSARELEPLRRQSRAVFSGAGPSLELSIGKRVRPRLVVGGLWQFVAVSDPPVVPGMTYVAPGTDRFLNVVAAFADYYPSPRRGLHVGGSAGVLAASNIDGDCCVRTHWGAALSVRVGYDVFFSRRWSVGALAQLEAYRYSSSEANVSSASNCLLPTLALALTFDWGAGINRNAQRPPSRILLPCPASTSPPTPCWTSSPPGFRPLKLSAVSPPCVAEATRAERGDCPLRQTDNADAAEDSRTPCVWRGERLVVHRGQPTHQRQLPGTARSPGASRPLSKGSCRRISMLPLKSPQHCFESVQVASGASLGAQTRENAEVRRARSRVRRRRRGPATGRRRGRRTVPQHARDAQFRFNVQALPPGRSGLQKLSFQSQ